MEKNMDLLIDWVIQLGFLDEKLESLKYFHPNIFDDYIGDSSIDELREAIGLANDIKKQLEYKQKFKLNSRNHSKSKTRRLNINGERPKIKLPKIYKKEE